MRALTRAAVLGSLPLCASLVARAAEPPRPAAVPDARLAGTEASAVSEGEPRAVSPARIALAGGVRALFVLGDGYEPFAEQGVLWALSLGGSTPVFTDGPMVLALGGTWDVARSDSTARSAETGLLVHRFTVTPEGRYQLGQRFRVFGRLGIGGSYVRAELDDRVVGAELRDSAGLFTVDPGVGAALRLGPTNPRQRVGVWVTLDGGYLWSTTTGLALTSGDAPARAAPIRLADLSLHGPYTRLSASVEF